MFATIRRIVEAITTAFAVVFDLTPDPTHVVQVPIRGEFLRAFSSPVAGTATGAARVNSPLTSGSGSPPSAPGVPSTPR